MPFFIHVTDSPSIVKFFFHSQIFIKMYSMIIFHENT